MNSASIVIAGATGNLGGRIARKLVEKGANVRVIVRSSSAPDKVEALRSQGATIAQVEFDNHSGLTQACSGGACVISVLSGLWDVIVKAQGQLLNAAVDAGVPRFIPSDFSIDFTKLPPGTNRNLDLRQEFRRRLDKAHIAATSILNGMFTDLLTGQAPFILFKIRRVVFWENADQPMDFTTMDDTAEFTAAASLDPSTPRFLRITGDPLSARELVEIASDVTGKNFRLLRAGSLRRLSALIRINRAILFKSNALYPPWQGMQYMHNMYSGRAKLDPIDNDRYPGMQWTNVRDVLAAR